MEGVLTPTLGPAYLGLIFYVGRRAAMGLYPLPILGLSPDWCVVVATTLHGLLSSSVVRGSDTESSCQVQERGLPCSSGKKHGRAQLTLKPVCSTDENVMLN